MTVTALMPSASVSIAAMVNPGVLDSVRTP